MSGTAALAPTLAPAQAGRTWDALVIGAGPAGALAARELARAGVRVLLVERHTFPRHKVCGGCLNAAALHTLAQAGLGDLPTGLGAVSLRLLRLVARGRVAHVPLPGGAAVSRAAFDAALARAAIAAGAQFLPATTANVGALAGNLRTVQLESESGSVTALARVVIAADGLAGRSLRAVPGFEPLVAAHARIGTSTIRPAAEAPAYAAGRICMAVGRGGYAGLVRLEDGRLNIAAALSVASVRAGAGPAGAVQAILAEAGLPAIAGLAAARWQGVPALTRRRRKLASAGLFVIGDAAGYIEPFTGEGMGWALASGVAVVPLALEALRHGWSPGLERAWGERYRRLLGARQRHCRLLTWLLRRPELVGPGIALLSWRPRLAWPYVASVNRPLAR